MDLRVTSHAKPSDVQRLCIVGVVRLHRLACAARLTMRRTCHIASSNRGSNRSACTDLKGAVLPSAFAVIPNSVGVAAFPVQHAQPIAFPVVLPPCVATRFGSLWVGLLPFLRDSFRAVLAPRRPSEWMPFASMECVNVKVQLAGAASLSQGGTIIQRNHYSFTDKGRA